MHRCPLCGIRAMRMLTFVKPARTVKVADRKLHGGQSAAFRISGRSLSMSVSKPCRKRCFVIICQAHDGAYAA